MTLVTLVYANIAISWQLLRFNSLKKHFPQIYRFKRFKNGLEKSSLIWNFFPWFWLKNPCFPLISLTGNSLQNFPWIPWFPWSVGTLWLIQKWTTMAQMLKYLSICIQYQNGFFVTKCGLMALTVTLHSIPNPVVETELCLMSSTNP